MQLSDLFWILLVLTLSWFTVCISLAVLLRRYYESRNPWVKKLSDAAKHGPPLTPPPPSITIYRGGLQERILARQEEPQ